jgi:hypothetical protein
MPSNQLAVPSFVTGPNDNLATVDVFTGTASGIVNSIASLAAQYDVDLIGMLRAGAAAAQLLPLVEGVANGAMLLNPTAAIARLVTASNTLLASVNGSPTVTTSFNTLSTGAQTSIAASGQTLGSVNATVGGVVSSIANGAISDIQSLGALINSFAGSQNAFLMVDTQAVAGMAAGIINQCAKYGIAGAFQQMVANITDPTMLNAIIQMTLPNLVQVSDLTSLQAVAAASSTAGIAAINPGVLSSFTTGYSRSSSGNAQQATPNQDGTTWSQISIAYNAVDPTWNTYPRSGDTSGTTLDLTSLQNGTDDFNSVLAAGVAAAASNDAVTPLYALAAAYDQVDVDTQLKAMYPNTYIDPALRSTQLSTQPTQLTSSGSSGVSAATSPTQIQNNSSTAVATTQPASDQVGLQPNAATYGINTAARYQSGATGIPAWTNTQINWGGGPINWGGGIASGDGYLSYPPVPAAA